MHPALLKLIELRVRAVGRRTVHGLKTPRGVVLTLIGGAMFVLWIGPVLFMGTVQKRAMDPEATRAAVPLALLVMCVWTIVNASGDKAIYFSPGEVNLLLGGPFRRRELLVYKLLFSVLGAAFSAVIFTAAFLAHFRWWLAAYLGIFLALGLIQLLGMSCLMIAQSVGERAYTRSRRMFLALLVALATLAALAALRAIHTVGHAGVMETLRRVRESVAGGALLSVFDVYGRAMTAGTLYPELLVWGGLALAINCALAVFVIWLDADYIEASVIQSQKQYERLQRIRRGGYAGWTGKAGKRGRLAPLPRLGGAGPVAWRQLQSVLRSSRGLLVVLAIFAAVGCLILSMGFDEQRFIPMLIMIGWMSVFLTQRITFDFRGDLDHIDVLKSLPLASVAITVGELVTPVLVLTLLQLVVVAVAVAWTRTLPQAFAYGAVIFLPVNLIVFEIDNLLFLLFPSRQMTGQPTDIQFIGRAMLMLFAKTILLGIASVLAGAVGFVAYLAVGRVGIVVIGAGAVMLGAIAAGLLPCVAWAFRRFDVSTETPP